MAMRLVIRAPAPVGSLAPCHRRHPLTFLRVQSASLGDSFQSFFDAVEDFFSQLASVRLIPLLLALVLFTIYLTLRARASFNILRAAYPTERVPFREIWGAYFAGYGFNAVIPARGGDVVRLFLTKTSIPNSSYPAVAASFVVELGFDVAMGSLILIFAFTQGVFPKPPDFAKLNAFDLSFFAQNPQLTLFVVTLLGVGGAPRGRAPERPRYRVLGADPAGVHDPGGPRALLPRGVRGPVRRLVLPLRRLLDAARGVQRGRLGQERAARARRERGLGRRAVHAAGGGGPAGAAHSGVRRDGCGRDRGRLLGWPADRHRRAHLRDRLHGARVHLPGAQLQGGHRARPRGPGEREGHGSGRRPAQAEPAVDGEPAAARSRSPRAPRAPE